MTYYLKPAVGVISTNLYHSYAECRLRYLTTLKTFLPSSENQDANFNNILSKLSHADCLIEGTAKDRVSHFALRSIAVLDPPLHSFIIQKETVLFRRRLAKMNYNELKTSVVLLLKQLIEYRNFKDGHEQFFLETESILREILKKRFLSHFIYVNGDLRINPNHHQQLILEVPFRHVLYLVGKREVQLQNGLAMLRCDQIPSYLTSLFTKLLEYSSKKIQETDCIQKIKADPRFMELLPLLKQIYSIAVPIPSITVGLKGAKLTLATVDELSNYFPPCMKALHHTLRSRHRLCHRPRIQYTLFLKDVGLPVDDCVQLIRTEYSRPAVQTDDNKKHKCEHSWDTDSRRYTYGTRHLYGLEGARKEYSSHSCYAIQRNSPGPNECGGCPFVHYDHQNMSKFLTGDLNGAENSRRFISHLKKEKIAPIESCHFHLRFKSNNLHTASSATTIAALKNLENSQVRIHNVFKPKHYFALLSTVK